MLSLQSIEAASTNELLELSETYNITKIRGFDPSNKNHIDKLQMRVYTALSEKNITSGQFEQYINHTRKFTRIAHNHNIRPFRPIDKIAHIIDKSFEGLRLMKAARNIRAEQRLEKHVTATFGINKVSKQVKERMLDNIITATN